MYVFKTIEKSDIHIEENVLHTKQQLTTSSLGLTSIQYRSGSLYNSNKTVSGSHWDFLNYTYYLSGSTTDEFNSPFYSSLYINGLHPQHRNKFHSSGSVIYIPNNYIGNSIDRGTFILTDLSYSSSIDGTINPIIKDDGWGNLYSTNAYVSQSGTTSISSSDNYVGNIIYEDGVVTLTETGSWSGSVNYTNIATNNYMLDFSTSHTIFTKKLIIEIRADEFNNTLNPTARGRVSGSTIGPFDGTPGLEPIAYSPHQMRTMHGFNPFITQIELYDKIDATQEPLIIANLSKVIEKIDDTRFIIEVEIDF